MAVAKMKLVEIAGKMDELDKVVEICCQNGDFQPESAMAHVANVKGFVPLTEENRYNQLLQSLTAIAGASGKTFECADYADFNWDDEKAAGYIGGLTSTIGSLQARKQAIEQDISEKNQALSQLKHFMSLDISLNEAFACKFIKIRFGRIPAESFEKLNDYNDNPYVLFFPCSHDTAYYWGVYVAPVEEVREIDRIFSSLYFERLRVPNSSASPKETFEQLTEEKNALCTELDGIRKELKELWEKEYGTCEKLFSLLTDKSTLFNTRRYAVRYNDKFYYLGWMPADEAEKFVSQLGGFDVDVKLVAPNVKLSAPPTKLKNLRIFKPFEFFVDMYGLPSYDEVDPTPLVAITYILFFGLMFADLGQGICVSLVGWWMYKFKSMKLGKALIPCGISSALFGTLFGSVFGFEHALDWFYVGILGMKSKPIEVMESNTAIMLIYSAVGLGIAMVICAMLANIYSCVKRKRYGEALFGCNGLSGLVFYACVIGLFAGQLIFGLPLVSVYTVCALIVLPIILIFLREPLGNLVEHKKSEEPVKIVDFIVQNFFEVFEFILSYLSNTVSFLRVSAFILVHAGMMTAVMTLAEMAHGVGFVLALIFGNVFVIALEGLLSGIQALRLDYYEIFSRFFDGKGRAFEPVKISKKAK